MDYRIAIPSSIIAGGLIAGALYVENNVLDSTPYQTHIHHTSRVIAHSVRDYTDSYKGILIGEQNRLLFKPAGSHPDDVGVVIFEAKPDHHISALHVAASPTASDFYVAFSTSIPRTMNASIDERVAIYIQRFDGSGQFNEPQHIIHDHISGSVALRYTDTLELIVSDRLDYEVYSIGSYSVDVFEAQKTSLPLSITMMSDTSDVIKVSPFIPHKPDTTLEYRRDGIWITK